MSSVAREQATRDIASPTPTEYLVPSQREVADFQTGGAAWVMDLSQQLSLLQARTMLHHLMSGWGDFPGGTPGREEQLQILNDGLLAQRTVYAAYREYGTLVVGEVVRQQAFFEHHAQADATEGTEQQGRDYAAHRAQLQTDQLQHLAVENARQLERYETDYREWRLQCPGRRAAPPDTMTKVDRAARCAACTERHSVEWGRTGGARSPFTAARLRRRDRQPAWRHGRQRAPNNHLGRRSRSSRRRLGHRSKAWVGS